ncbi:hypothetical protein [Treponema sp. OMZ 857]|nr:hypothetical protein [Treponema sp. OMZ 857]UTC43584.1 hypothetical protein E4N66_05560 [Treponema sp. OMZ 857]
MSGKLSLKRCSLNGIYFIISASTADAISVLQIRILQSSSSEYLHGSS